MSDHSELKRLAEAFPADLDFDSNTEPFFNGQSGESLGGGSTGFYSVYGKPFLIEGDDYEYDGPTYVETCNVDFAKFMVAAREGVLALIAEVEQLKADLQGELSAAKEDARRQRADQIAYRAAVYRLKREAPGEVVGGARLQRLFLISNDNAQILLSAMKERGDLFKINEKPWGGMVPCANSEILGEQP